MKDLNTVSIQRVKGLGFLGSMVKKQVNLRTEIVAGLTTFFTMLYVIVVNPSILSSSGTGIPFSGALTATVLLAFSMTLLMGVYANLPFAVAPGMGINAFFTFTIVLRNHVPWPVALGIVFWSGVLFLICSLTPIREKIANAIPENLRVASAVGIGLFLTFIGLKNAGLVVADPVTFVKLGKLDIKTIFVILGLLVMVALFRRRNPFAFLAGMGLITLLAFSFGLIQWPQSIVSRPDFDSVFMKLDIPGALRLAFLPSIVSLIFTGLFDSISTFLGCSYAGGLKDERGRPLRMREGLIVDAWAALLAALLGTSSGTAYVESSAGIEAGGRTGITSIVTAFCFLPFLFLAPLAGMVPSYATAPVLIVVGALMFRQVRELKLGRVEELIPAFLAIVLIPLTFSITQGVLWGLSAHVVLYLLFGRKDELEPTVYVLSALSVVLIAIENVHF